MTSAWLRAAGMALAATCSTAALPDLSAAALREKKPASDSRLSSDREDTGAWPISVRAGGE
ncbi:hypothetical protein FIM10_15485 [Sphingomonadales bacterium 56]|uniref:Uncharacterized protein n=1 Tax=Sphingobium agri TaxID=2933566 RepID=A0ABT0DTW6_9SPHN|nr:MULTISPECIES: hypothetical protein [Sphingobium]MBY2930079.1 hypothetical protein [Sphingomonadales bacterium 56]MBY2960233.1 hypothetical protein [Sphingomonadales bacterium 58]MCK0530553.1 hypothetical protein [Sphingobium agri]